MSGEWPGITQSQAAGVDIGQQPVLYRRLGATNEDLGSSARLLIW